MRANPSRTAEASTRRITGDCDRSTRKASVTEGPREGSEVRLAKSASTSGLFDSSAPVAISVPTEPMPRIRIAMYPPARMASAANASPPPIKALRQVSSCRTPPSGFGVWVMLIRALARRRSASPVATMIGKPSASSTATPGTTHEGSPTLTVMTQAMPSTTAEARLNSTATRTGCPCSAEGAVAGAAAVYGAVAVGVMPPGVLSDGVLIASICWTSSSALCGRSAGFFSRHRMISIASAGGTLVAEPLHRLRLLRHVRGDDPLRGGRLEGLAAAEHLVGDDAERIEIGSVVGMRIGGRLLGRHVGGRAERHAHGGQLAGAGALLDGLGDAEVGHQGVAPGKENVVRLDVAVDDALLVRHGQRVGHVADDAHRFRDGEFPLARQLGAERFALDEGHDVEEEVALAPGGQEGDDVRMLQAGGESHLTLEALDAHGGGGLRGEDLHDHLALDLHLFGEEDATHPAPAELAQDPVAGANRVLHLALEISQAVHPGKGIME